VSLLARMMQRVGKEPSDLTRSSRVGRIMRCNGVPNSDELKRILGIYRRRWEDIPPEVVADVSNGLKKRWGTMSLKPIQVAALCDLHDFGGMLGPIRVGGGKTLVSLLAAEVSPAERPILLIPAKLREKTLRESKKLSEHFRFPPCATELTRATREKSILVVSYETLGRTKGAALLAEYNPGLIIADECHKLKNTRPAVTRRVSRYMNENPSTVFVAMSGTIMKRSLRDYAHIAEWCLGDLSPLPLHWGTLQDWADALDEKVAEGARMHPGALLKLCNEEERAEYKRDPLAAVRHAYRRRLIETPGVIATQEGHLGCSLQITAVEPKVSQATVEAFGLLRNAWQTPDGWEVLDGASVWRHARELALGFYYRWNPRPPEEWLEARAAWAKFVRYTITHNQRRLDSEKQIAQACARNLYPREAYDQWKRVKNTFKPRTEAVWIDEGPLNFAAKWMGSNTGIVWVEHVAFGRKLAEVTGRPYFHRKGLNDAGAFIEDARAADGCIIASIGSNSEGRNLQDQWSNNLLTTVPGSGDVWEQLLGRTHRDGQEADEVFFEMMMSCLENWQGFEQARSDARTVQDTKGQAQKILFADVTVASAEEVARRGGALWSVARR